MKDARLLTSQVGADCDKVYLFCNICTSKGRPTHKKKIYLSHVNEAFNREIQEGFNMKYIKVDKYEVLNVVYSGNEYGDRTI